MYPNITNDLGLTACRELLDTRNVQDPSTDCIVEAIQITLEENIAEFNQTVIKQCDGTAMGPHHACSYADIAADKAVDKKVMDPDLNPYNNCIEDWFRFRDDIMCMWVGSEEDPLNFNAWLNQVHPRLKFTIDYITTTNVFRDVRLTVEGNIVKTSMFSKSCDPHAYLMPTSCHPLHISRNIPKVS